jgi:hypothetical protein
VAPGTVIVKHTNLFDAGNTSEIAEGTMFVIDGSASPELGSGQEVVLPTGTLTGTAVRTFPATMVDSDGILTVAYCIEGEAGKLFARRFDGYNVGSPFILANLRAQGTSGSDAISIYGPILAWNKDTHTGYAAWWCGGKIMAAPISTLVTSDKGTCLSPILLVAGSRDFTATGNSANGSLLALKESGNLIVNQGGNAEADVPRQRVGMFASRKAPYQGKLFIWYKDADGKIRAREVSPGLGVSAPVVIE